MTGRMPLRRQIVVTPPPPHFSERIHFRREGRGILTDPANPNVKIVPSGSVCYDRREFGPDFTA